MSEPIELTDKEILTLAVTLASVSERKDEYRALFDAVKAIRVAAQHGLDEMPEPKIKAF